MFFKSGRRRSQSKDSFLKWSGSALQTFASPISARIELWADGSKSLDSIFGDPESLSTVASSELPCALPGSSGTTRVVVSWPQCCAHFAAKLSEVKLASLHGLATGDLSAA